MKIIFTCMLGILSILPSISQAEIYKCMIAGKLVFTDQPCDGEKVILGETTFIPAEEKPFEYVPTKAAYSSNQWYYGYAGYKRAVRLLSKYDAPIFLYFQADWCGYCRKLEKGLINTRKGRLALKKVIKVKITPEDSKQDNKFFRSLGGNGYPSIYLQADALSSPEKMSTFSKQYGKWKMISFGEFNNLLSEQKKES